MLLRLGEHMEDPGYNIRSVPMVNLIWTIITVLFVIWLAGLLLHIGGGLIHLLLVVAVILVVFNLLTKGRAEL
jgi:hypothetical protein